MLLIVGPLTNQTIEERNKTWLKRLLWIALHEVRPNPKTLPPRPVKGY